MGCMSLRSLELNFYQHCVSKKRQKQEFHQTWTCTSLAFRMQTNKLNYIQLYATQLSPVPLITSDRWHILWNTRNANSITWLNWSFRQNNADIMSVLHVSHCSDFITYSTKLQHTIHTMTVSRPLICGFNSLVQLIMKTTTEQIGKYSE